VCVCACVLVFVCACMCLYVFVCVCVCAHVQPHEYRCCPELSVGLCANVCSLLKHTIFFRNFRRISLMPFFDSWPSSVPYKKSDFFCCCSRSCAPEPNKVVMEHTNKCCGTSTGMCHVCMYMYAYAIHICLFRHGETTFVRIDIVSQ